MNENITARLVRLLEGRGRWIRAGNDNIVRYLSVHLQCGPNHLRELQAVLIESAPPLHVDHEGGRITRVGLQAWVDSTSVETEDAIDLPNDMVAALDYIIRLSDENRRLEAISAASTDGAEALRLAIECDEQNRSLSRQLKESQARVTELETLVSTFDVAGQKSLETRLANANSALDGLRRTVGGQSRLLSQQDQELAAQQRELDGLRKVRAFLDSDEGKMLLMAYEDAQRIAVSIRAVGY